MPAGLRGGFAYKVAFHQAISELEPLSQSEQALQNPWDANIVARVNHLIDEGNVTLVPMHHLATAYKVVTPHQIRAVVDGVRTRVLNLALDLEKIAPDADEPDAAPVDAVKVRYVINDNIYGDGNAIAMGSAGATQHTSVVKPGNLTSLLQAVAEAGLPPDEVAALEQAMKADSAEGAGPPFRLNLALT